ncbi:MAG: Phosphoenolpyruvate synthase/pyruvate phosphate dikinase [Candidatus Roizmanbacteria bacterium GW2011_GWC2_37_13]|uniref:Phosphoenolpyruvate synthase/pyruvate phosphate dikinase n=1 Tax=Candidatus Roizmanbacteria bacterium GW2011_GWC2_37_13 TaxID=1618486 RepID=A0A0G0GIT9_9BACT|nr:MAG: Phosphoenolpyruvate synthase/pyruvate phosphate dikinase [Candidatus Roizmanbacteria bacterium GW2011_GWC1_37_12]KKQ26025.1 MAG: Phosphoenolpyruvate synthase/pyruvate phosphate dikinase [Candidatus Roizmanbacteria bacterium GW2011_GWC2_37_13]
MSQTDVIAKLFGSRSRVSILKLFLIDYRQQYRVNEVARKAKVNKRLASTELKKLVDIGIVLPNKIGKTVFFHINQSSFLVQPLKEIFSDHDWHEWERPSRIHHLIMTLEAGLKPMKDYYGICLPNLYNVFDYDNVTIFLKISEFRDVGKRLIPIYLKNKKKVWDDFHKFAATFSHCKDYSSFYEQYIEFWKVAYITEPVSFYIDSLLKPGEHITIQEKSFTDEYENLLWKYAKEAEKKGIRNIDVEPILINYFWIRNSYYGVHQLTEEEIITEIKAKMHKVKKKAVIIPSPISLSSELIQIGRDMILMQDIRKKYMMKAAYYLHKHLKSIGNEYGISPLLMEQTVPSEVLNYKKILPKLKEELSLRLRSCTVITSLKKGVQVFSGQKMFPKGISKTSQIEVRGTVACGGKGVGRAKIVKNIDEMYKVNHGDIIVSPMTSPDIMPAIRRCVAIVTDFGGITCHASIVAREFNIPCIVGTNNATQKIKDDDLIEVDANNGVVRILKQ